MQNMYFRDQPFRKQTIFIAIAQDFLLRLLRILQNVDFVKYDFLTKERLQGSRAPGLLCLPSSVGTSNLSTERELLVQAPTITLSDRGFYYRRGLNPLH